MQVSDAVKELVISKSVIDRCFKIAESNRDPIQLLKITTPLEYLVKHMPDNKLERSLNWIIANNYTGPKFIEWFSVCCQNSNLQMIRVLNSVCDNAKPGLVIGGKDFKL
jgi:hypothetical protein